jgi:hypothetical protein
VIDYAVKPRVNKTQTGVEKAGVKHWPAFVNVSPLDNLDFAFNNSSTICQHYGFLSP